MGHNLIVGDMNVAVDILQKVNYYRLSAYGIGLTKPGNKEQYLDGTTLKEIYRLYCFDSRLRNILMHIIEQLEVQLRTQIANFLALKYGPEGYISPLNFKQKITKNGEDIHTLTIEKFKQECVHQKNIPFVRHHLQNYNGHFPIWVAVELFTFGALSSLFDIMRDEDQKEIARLYKTAPAYLNSWMLALVEVRNICAHYGRIYNLPLKQSPFLYSENKKYRIYKFNKLFPVLITIKRMLLKDSRWQDFACELEILVNEYEDVIKFSFIGFPSDWKTVLAAL